MLHQIEPTATASRLHVNSEVGTLRRVSLYRPDLELRRLTPRNREALLFDDVLWVKRARQEPWPVLRSASRSTGRSAAR